MSQSKQDVCIIGAGITGLTAALELLEKGYSVRVLEARQIGAGASGCNAGQLLPGYALNQAELQQSVGKATADRMLSLSHAALSSLLSRIQKNQMECGLHQNQYRVQAKNGTVHEVQNTYYFDTGRYLFELANLIRKKGGLIMEHCGPIKRVDRGSLQAHFVILATNASDLMGPLIPKKMASIKTYKVMTARLPGVEVFLPVGVAVANPNSVVHYLRVDSAYRLIMGCHIWSVLDPQELIQQISQAVLKHVPIAQDLKIVDVQGAWVGVTANRLPHFGRIQPQVFYARGFAGKGLVLGSMAGDLMARAIDGDASDFELLEAIPHQDFVLPKR